MRDIKRTDPKSLFRDLSEAGDVKQNSWKIRQNDILDKKTSFIYEKNSLIELRLESKAANLTGEQSAYAEHRWRNFKRHDAWLALICQKWPDVELPANSRDSDKDFILTLSGVKLEFDLKVTRLPKSVPDSLSDGELAIWMYRNQSQESRFHLKNRMFVIANDEIDLYNYELALAVIERSYYELDSKLLRIDFSRNNKSAFSVVIRL